MVFARNGAVLRQVGTLFERGASTGDSPEQLLDAFLLRGDEAAFEAIVARYGPMVLGVCRRLLNDPHDVDDAFQVTFLVLARRGATVRDKGRLGTWLYAVARSASARTRRASARRRYHEGRRAADVLPYETPRDVEAGELGAVLDEEIGRLPERFRLPLILCHLDGRSQDEAARELRWTVGMVRGRLARAREILQGRLIRRGVSVPAGVAAALAASEARAVGIPPVALVAATARAAVGMVNGRRAAAGVASTWAAALTREVLTEMRWTRLKTLAAGALAVGTLAAVAAGPLAAQRPEAAPKGTALAKPSTAPKAKAAAEQERWLTVSALLSFKEGPRPFVWKLLDLDPDRPDAFSERAVPDEVGAMIWLAPGGRALAWARGGRDVTLWCRNADGETRPLMEVGKASETTVDVSFSPDAKRVVVSVGALSGGRDLRRYANWVMNADGSGRAKLSLPETDRVQDWSPDGLQLLADSTPDSTYFKPSQGGPRWELRQSNLDGTGAKRLALCRMVQDARYSPDGRSIAFVGVPESADHAGLWLLNADGTGLRQVADLRDQSAGHVCWSPDGKRLVFRVSDDAKVRLPDGRTGTTVRDMRLEIVDLDGKNRRRVVLPKSFDVGVPDWR